MHVSSVQEKPNSSYSIRGECKPIQPTFRLDASNTREPVKAFRSIIHKADYDLHFYHDRSSGKGVPDGGHKYTQHTFARASARSSKTEDPTSGAKRKCFSIHRLMKSNVVRTDRGSTALM